MSVPTLGPWSVRASVGRAPQIIDAEGIRVVAFVTNYDLDNACLIAAAPDLLAAAQDALSLLEGYLVEYPHITDSKPEIRQLRRAIASACGEAVPA